jgi:chromosomal replication initiator protein
VNQDLAHIWDDVRTVLRRTVPDATFDIWLAPLEAEALDGLVLTASRPPSSRAGSSTASRASWTRRRPRCSGRAHACRSPLAPRRRAGTRSGPATAAGRAQAARRSAPGAAGGGPAPPPAAPEPAEAPPPEAGLNPKLSFGQFIIGDGNHLAHAAALSVAELPGQAYNPLFIYGPPGVGKTHLLHSIGNYVLASGGGLTVHATTAERFANEFITSLQRGSGAIDRLRGRLRAADVLLIDDVQFLESKAKTEAEFFHTFNALYDAGAQLVLTSDRLPADLDALEDRLRERFESGPGHGHPRSRPGPPA